MSYILDALNKSEQERTRQSQPPSLPQAPQHRLPERPSTWMYPGLAAIMVLIAAATGYYLAKSTTDAPRGDTASKSVANQTSPAPVAKPSTPAAQASRTIAEKRAASPPLGGANDTDRATKRVTTKSQSPTVVQVPAVPQPQRQPERTPQAVAANTPTDGQVPETVIKSFEERAAATRAAASTAAQAERATATVDAEQPKVYKPQPPHISELDWSIRNTLPDIEYTAHVYSNSGGSGFVILNGSMRYNGYRVGQDLYVREILEDGVVLEYRGTKFRLSAMKSWRKQE